MIDEHKPTVELNNNNNNNNNKNKNNNNNNNYNNRSEWEIQLIMHNNCISTKSFEETRTIYTKSEPLINLLIQFYKDFNMHKKHHIIEQANLLLVVLNYYNVIFKE